MDVAYCGNFQYYVEEHQQTVITDADGDIRKTFNRTLTCAEVALWCDGFEHGSKLGKISGKTQAQFEMKRALGIC